MGAKVIKLGSWEYAEYAECMPVSLFRIIHHSHSFTRLEIYHHIYFIRTFMLPPVFADSFVAFYLLKGIFVLTS